MTHPDKTIIIIIIITLFQVDNIFGTNMVLNYKDIDAFDNYKKWNFFKVCTEQVRSPHTEYTVSGLPTPTRLEGVVRFILAQDQQVLEVTKSVIIWILLPVPLQGHANTSFLVTSMPDLAPIIRHGMEWLEQRAYASATVTVCSC